MALSRVRHAPLDIELTQALSEYESCLSEEQKAQFRSEEAPDAMAAVRLTGIIDKQCNEGRRRCMGPRLILFLESVHQFSTVVDAFVSSHPETAALVWGGVKLTLLAANNVSSYFDRLSNFLMEIGKDCPRIKAFGSLYPSEGLQKAWYDYSASVIRLCKYIMENFRKPAHIQWSHAFFSFRSHFGSYEAEIKRLARVVQEEASLASQQAQRMEIELQMRERIEQGKSRKIVTKLQESFRRRENESHAWRLDIARRRLETGKLKALDLLSSYDYQAAYRRLRRECVPGTSQWILAHPDLDKWRTGSPQHLWLTGRLGTGKSMISSCIVSSLLDDLSDQYLASYFFCRFDEEESLQCKTIVGSIIRQLVINLPAEKFDMFGQKYPSQTAMVDFLQNALSREKQHFIVLDGLEECEDGQMRAVVETLHDLFDCSGLRSKIFISSRPTVPGWLRKFFSAQARIDLDSKEARLKIVSDIEAYISATLIDWLNGEEPELHIGDRTVIPEVCDRLVEGSDGMFEWVRLQLQDIRETQSDDQIRAALNDLPQGLPETFRRILLRRLRKDPEGFGSRIFGWTAVVKRPLALEELREAISIRALQSQWEPGALINNIRKTLEHCGNLLFVDEETKTVRFAHSSVKQYLLSKVASPEYFVDREQVNHDIGIICVTYLNLPMFDTRLVRTRKEMHANDVATAVVEGALKGRTFGGNLANRVALRLLKHEEQPKIPVGSLLQSTAGDSLDDQKQDYFDQYRFRSYAKQFWLEHTQNGYSPDSKVLWKLWCNLIEDADSRDTLADVPWTADELRQGAPVVAEWIAAKEHCSMAHLVFTLPTDIAHEMGRKLVDDAVLKNKLRLLAVCLDFMQADRSLMNSKLTAAAADGFLDIVNTIMNAATNVIETLDIQRALYLAAAFGHLDIVKRLLQSGADSNHPATPGGGRTALQAAASGGHLDVLERLLQSGADPNAPAAEFDGRTALQAAAESGKLDIVERLLQSKADVNAAASPRCGHTALEFAIEDRHLDVVRRLLKEGAHVDKSVAKDLKRLGIRYPRKA